MQQSLSVIAGLRHFFSSQLLGPSLLMDITIGTEPTPALVSLAASARALQNQILRIERDGPELEDATRALDALRESLERVSAPGNIPRILPTSQVDPAEGTRPYYFPGALSPWVHVLPPWMTAKQEKERRFGRVRFDLIHEGPPSTVHGGFLAWTFDQIFGQHVVAGDSPGPTHQLSVTFRRPTPLLEELEYEARTDRIEGRKQFVSGVIRHGDVVTAEATGLFVKPKES